MSANKHGTRDGCRVFLFGCKSFSVRRRGIPKGAHRQSVFSCCGARHGLRCRLPIADRCHSLPDAVSATGGAWVTPPFGRLLWVLFLPKQEKYRDGNEMGVFYSLPQSAALTAPSSEGALGCAIIHFYKGDRRGGSLGPFPWPGARRPGRFSRARRRCGSHTWRSTSPDLL